MHALLRLTLPLAFVMIGGCAAVPAKRDPRDPWERVNRTTYAFNDHLDRAIARPVAKAYQAVTPSFVRTGVSNFWDNYSTTTTIVNDALQGRVGMFFSDLGRLVMNTTLGIGGLFDPASAAGLPRNTADFGQTLGKWGLGTGPYLVLPLLGPSDVRDTFGRAGDHFTTVSPYVLNSVQSLGVSVVQLVDTRYRLLSTDALVNQAYDRYGFVRNAYLQRRCFIVHPNKPCNGDEEENDKLLDELEKEDQQGKQAAPQNPAPQPQSQPR
jgi:phospholipid-binding lipoprotein MlaA